MRPYLLTQGRVWPRHDLRLETVLTAGPGRPRPDAGEEYGHVVCLCEERQRSVAELAGLLRRPVGVIKVIVSDLVDDEALRLPLHAFTHGTADGASTQLLEAVLVGLHRIWPEVPSAVPRLRAG
ncbi:DUF742 domain-containing protein [Streptomyces sp. 4F14]|uniref:DUF742 domain-containing protein n=1 Tax=Streptomyces sp. 4F14 TaxID=3394380 RepID=UPI003A84C44D